MRSYLHRVDIILYDRHPYTSEIQIKRHKGKMPMWIPRILDYHQKQGERHTQDSLRTLRKNEPHWHLDFELLAFRTVKEYISIRLNYTVFDIFVSAALENWYKFKMSPHFLWGALWIDLTLSWASLMAQTAKNLPVMQETWVWSLGWEDSPGGRHGNWLQYSCLENPHGQRSRVGYSPRGPSQELDTTVQ